MSRIVTFIRPLVHFYVQISKWKCYYYNFHIVEVIVHIVHLNDKKAHLEGNIDFVNIVYFEIERFVAHQLVDNFVVYLINILVNNKLFFRLSIN